MYNLIKCPLQSTLQWFLERGHQITLHVHVYLASHLEQLKITIHAKLYLKKQSFRSSGVFIVLRLIDWTLAWDVKEEIYWRTDSVDAILLIRVFFGFCMAAILTVKDRKLNASKLHLLSSINLSIHFHTLVKTKKFIRIWILNFLSQSGHTRAVW